jgi:hypothetical protein
MGGQMRISSERSSVPLDLGQAADLLKRIDELLRSAPGGK